MEAQGKPIGNDSLILTSAVKKYSVAAFELSKTHSDGKITKAAPDTLYSSAGGIIVRTEPTGLIP